MGKPINELRWLRKAECDVQRNKSTTVVKNNVRMVKDLVTEKIGIEVSRQAEGQRLAVEQVDAEKYLAAGECRSIGQWEHCNRRHAKEAEGRTTRRAARNKYIKRKKKRGSRKAPQAAPAQCGPILLTPTKCFNLDRTNSSFKWYEGRKAGTNCGGCSCCWG